MNTSQQDNRITVIGETNWRNEHKRFGIKRADRRAHMHMIGATGTGKSTLLANLSIQDMKNGEGLAVIDPHGDLVEQLWRAVPDERRRDVVYFNVPDLAQSIAFNPLEVAHPRQRPLVASGLISILKKIWPEFWGPRMEYILRNVLMSILELPNPTLLDVPRMLTDQAFRHHVLARVLHPQLLYFWKNEFEKYPANFRAEAIAPIQNKVGELLVNPFVRRIVAQPRSSFNPRQLMDEGKILLVNLAKGSIGEDSTALIGGMLVNAFSLAALSRSDTASDSRRDFYLYLDEFPSYTTTGLASLLSEMRKYGLGLVLSHQFLQQVDESVRDAILGNVGTLIAFRVGLTDAELLEKEFYPELTAEDLVRLPNYHVYLRLMIDGVKSKAFSARTLTV